MSKPIVVNIPHELGRAEARRRIDEGVTHLTGQIGAMGEVKRTWQGDILTFSMQAIGQTVSGNIAVADHDVRLEVDLPGIFAMVANKLKGRLQNEGRVLLAGPKRR